MIPDTIITVAIIFLVVLCILWFLLPFAVFGIKDKLDILIQQNKKLIEHIEYKEFKETK